ncbi:uncharacterized protein LOC135164719 [Diachasmimorpha longicaudata]|uniref:uncharacterized protein LOC135164719 n=1 Tax=Diachasmimorpha longicaudata TaxID=58733 RepID=UPI0030B8737C
MSRRGIQCRASRSPPGDEVIPTGGVSFVIRPVSVNGLGRQTARRSRVSIHVGRQSTRRSRRFTPGDWSDRLSISPPVALWYRRRLGLSASVTAALLVGRARRILEGSGESPFRYVDVPTAHCPFAERQAWTLFDRVGLVNPRAGGRSVRCSAGHCPAAEREVRAIGDDNSQDGGHSKRPLPVVPGPSSLSWGGSRPSAGHPRGSGRRRGSRCRFPEPRQSSVVPSGSAVAP